MKDSLRLYRTLLDFVWQPGVRFHDLRCLYTFIWAIVGVILSECISLSKWSLFRDSRAKAASKERQFSRWLHNDNIKPYVLYQPLIREALATWEHETITLALDTSLLWNRFVIVRLALIYRGRAVSVGWTVLAQSSATVAFEHYAPLLYDADSLLPAGSRVTLLADRGFMSTDLMRLCRRLAWNFCIRAKLSLLVHRATKGERKLKAMVPPCGRAVCYHTVWITGQRFGPVHMAVATVPAGDTGEVWAIISDTPTSLDTFETYGLRFDIEESFLDDKSAGFQLESSRIRDADALGRLCFVLATATLYLVSTGTATVITGRRSLVDPHWFRGLSYLQIGWRWVRRALTFGKRLLSFIWLQPGPDPEPAIASRRQASQSEIPDLVVSFEPAPS